MFFEDQLLVGVRRGRAAVKLSRRRQIRRATTKTHVPESQKSTVEKENDAEDHE